MSPTTRKRTIVAAAMLCAAVLLAMPRAATAAWGHTTLPCTADFDCSGEVDVLDLLQLLDAWGPCKKGYDCPEDLNQDGVVDVIDLLTLLDQWGPCAFQYVNPDNPEAWQIGLEMPGPNPPFHPSPEDYQRIIFDQASIRTQIPALDGVTHFPKWVDNQLLVSLDPNQPHDGFECLNTHFQLVNMQHLFSTWWVLTFAGSINVEFLAVGYASLPEVLYAEPNYWIGGDKFWVPTVGQGGVWHWFIDDGWHDCFDGCDCHRYYWIDTHPDGTVILTDYQEVGMPWCEF
jgi:hypothetical protein